MRIGICDTTFARFDMSAAAIDELKNNAYDLKIIRHATQRNCFANDRFCNIYRQQCRMYLCIAITHLQSRIIPRFLVTQGSYRFYDIDDILKDQPFLEPTPVRADEAAAFCVLTCCFGEAFFTSCFFSSTMVSPSSSAVKSVIPAPMRILYH